MTTQRRIEIVDHDPSWTRLFDSEAARLKDVFEVALSEIHHAGSTAVEGLRAKPTIDILVVVPRGADIPSADSSMEELGYTCRGECLDAPIPGTPGRFYYVRKDGVVHLVHVHACAVGHSEIEDKLAFRDYLRSHDDEASRYGHHKSQLAEEFVHDNLGYMRGKEAMVKQLLAKSLRWRRGTAEARAAQPNRRSRTS